MGAYDRIKTAIESWAIGKGLQQRYLSGGIFWTALSALREITTQIGAELDAVRALRETDGPTVLALGAIADGQFMRRSGGSIVGATAGGSSPLTTKGDLFGYAAADARVPVGTDGDVLTASSVAGPGVAWQALAVDAVAGTGSLRTLGTGAQQACAGDDARLSDARTPTAHASAHNSAGGDAIKLDELAEPTDVTTLNASASAHGLLPKLDGTTTNFLRGDGTWSAPTGGSGVTFPVAAAISSLGM